MNDMKKAFLLFLLVFAAIFMFSCGTIHQKIKYSNKDIAISNPCSGDEIDFKLISLIGDKDAQTMTLNCRIINRNVNKDIYIGGNLVAYDTEGNEHNVSNGQKYRALTDKKVDFSIKIPGQVLPKKVKKMAVIAFDIDNCRIELRNVPIIWRKNKENNK